MWGAWEWRRHGKNPLYLWMSLAECDCGRLNGVFHRVVHGREAPPNGLPWQVRTPRWRRSNSVVIRLYQPLPWAEWQKALGPEKLAHLNCIQGWPSNARWLLSSVPLIIWWLFRRCCWWTLEADPKWPVEAPWSPNSGCWRLSTASGHPITRKSTLDSSRYYMRCLRHPLPSV